MAEIANLVSVNAFVLLLLPFFSGMVFDFIQPGMVFSKYGDWVFHEERLELDMPKWKKPLFGCLKCTHVWVCIIYLILAGDFNIINLLYISLSYFILTLFYYR